MDRVDGKAALGRFALELLFLFFEPQPEVGKSGHQHTLFCFGMNGVWRPGGLPLDCFTLDHIFTKEMFTFVLLVKLIVA